MINVNHWTINETKHAVETITVLINWRYCFELQSSDVKYFKYCLSVLCSSAKSLKCLFFRRKLWRRAIHIYGSSPLPRQHGSYRILINDFLLPDYPFHPVTRHNGKNCLVSFKKITQTSINYTVACVTQFIFILTRVPGRIHNPYPVGFVLRRPARVSLGIH